MDSNLLRAGVFLGVLCLMTCLEAMFPRKGRTQGRKKRWLTNIGLVFIAALMTRLLGAMSAMSVAIYALDQGWGLLAKFPLPYTMDVILGFILLDLAIYTQHVLSHKIPIVWRVHKVHHADRDIDATTGVRFHPIEICLSLLYKCVIVIVLGPLWVSVLIFEILLNASAMFNHANLRLPRCVDKILRMVLVTPDMHRVHHSTITAETNSNYGFCLSFWDRLFRTYIEQPKQGHSDMEIGLAEFRTSAPSGFIWSLLLPFK